MCFFLYFGVYMYVLGVYFFLVCVFFASLFFLVCVFFFLFFPCFWCSVFASFFFFVLCVCLRVFYVYVILFPLVDGSLIQANSPSSSFSCRKKNSDFSPHAFFFFFLSARAASG